MQQPDKPSGASLREASELADATVDVIAEAALRLPPAARSRLLAFMHLLEEPESTVAELNVTPAGFLRLVLTNGGVRTGARPN